MRSVTFDLWRTLLEDTAEEERSVARTRAIATLLAGAGHDLPDDAIIAALDRTAADFWAQQERDHRDRGPAGHAEDLLRHLGVANGSHLRDALAHEIATMILRFPPSLIDGAAEAVRVAAARCPVGLVSNTGFSPGASLRQILDDLGVGAHFRTLAFSDEVGWAKPHAAIFEHALAGLGARPGDVLHVGDMFQADVAGARSLGMRTLWIASNGGATPPGAAPADATAGSIRDAIPAIHRWLTEGAL